MKGRGGDLMCLIVLIESSIDGNGPSLLLLPLQFLITSVFFQERGIGGSSFLISSATILLSVCSFLVHSL